MLTQPYPVYRQHYGVACILAALLGSGFLSGCAGRFGGQPVAEVLQDESAQALMRAGNFTAAAEEYLRLASQLSPAQAYPYRIYGAEAYLEAGLPGKALPVLRATEIPDSDTKFSAWKRLLQARVALGDRDYATAREQLGPIQVQDLPRPLQTQILGHRALTLNKLGDARGALRDYVELDSLLSEPAALAQNRRATWEVARRLGNRPAIASDSADPTIHGWLELARIVESSGTKGSQLQAGITDWRQRFPQHPGHSLLTSLSAAPLKPDAANAAGTRIALLLPLSGQFANAGAAIRDGILAAWFSEGAAGGSKPSLTVYDTTAKNVTAQYKRAVTEGATAIIGPLEKNAVTALARDPMVTLPTVVLNQPDDESVSNTASASKLYTFGLAPEEEAQQVAERAWFDGHTRGYILAPDSPWGNRIANAFRSHFQSIGGQILGQHRYGAAVPNDAGHATEISTPSGKAEAAATAPIDDPSRTGADFVFLGAFPQQGRQYARQLAGFPTRLAVYSTSHIFSGRLLSEADRDLDGVMFCDMPWLLDVTRQSTGLPAVVKQAWPSTAENFSRLYALGVDAYHILPYLDGLKTQSVSRFDGETGVLAIDNAGRIHRQLVCARFNAGVLTPLDLNNSP